VGPEDARKTAPGRIIAARIGDSDRREDLLRNENRRFMIRRG
jgi:hypothetical protein